MRVTLVHNPKAGDGDHDRDSLLRLLRTAGYEVQYVSAEEPSWQAALDSPADLIAVAGGDGTVGTVIRRLGPGSPPVAVLPAGTANNIATRLGLVGRAAGDLIDGWKNARRQPFDVGLLRSANKTSRFVESVGVGLLAAAFSTIDGDERLVAQLARSEDPVAAAIDVYRRLLIDLQPAPVELQVDARDMAGEYLLLEILNFGMAGPNLRLAPDAQSADGLLEVVLVEERQREELLEHLASYRTNPSTAPRLTTIRAREISLHCHHRHVHVDDTPHPRADGDPWMHVSIEPDSVTILV